MQERSSLHINILSRSLLGTPTVSQWPEIAQCLYYQTGLPRFPLDDVQLCRLPMSNECRQFLKVILH